MPSVSITVPETIESISRPIIYNIIESIKKYTIIRGDVRIIYPGDIGQWTQTTGDLGNKTKESQFTSSRYMQIEVEQTPVENNLNSTALYYAENPPIIADKDTRFWVTPVYSRMEVTVTVKFVTYNKDEAFRWYYNNRTAISNMRDVIMHTISYHYPLPDPLIDLVELIYTLKEKQAGNGETYAQYVQNHFTNRTTIISALDGKSKRLAIAETQTRLLGQFDFNPLPEKPEMIEDTACWVCSFDYKLTYDMPMSLNIRYPIMVHNQVLPYPYTELTLDPYNLRNKELQFPISLGALRMFEVYNLSEAANPVFRIPKIDDFVPKNAIPHTSGIIYALIELDPNNITQLLNLKELDYVVMNKDILEFIAQGEYQYITQPYQSVLNISLYDFDTLMDSSYLSVDSNLNVTTTVTLDLRKTYRIRISICNRLDVLYHEALYRLFYFIPEIAPIQYESVPVPTSTLSLEDIIGEGFNINMSIFQNGVSVPVENSNGTMSYQMIQNYTGSATPSSVGLSNTGLSINPNIIQNDILGILNKSIPAPIDINTTNYQTNSPYSPFYTVPNNSQKQYLINNLFVNKNYRIAVADPNGSAVFNHIINFLNISPVEVNKIYRIKKGKNLYVNINTGLNDFTSPRMFGDKTLQMMSTPAYYDQNNFNDIGFMTVMKYSIASISVSGE